ncbi:hypothetical protein D3C72_1633310 [compost metagenome]
MPPTGNQPSFTENMMISMMPSQKLGAAKHSTANADTALSHQVLTLTADTMPAATPTSTAMAMLASISTSVAGRWARITSSTGRLCRYE